MALRDFNTYLTAGGVTLDVPLAAAEAGQLILSYQVINELKDPIYLVNRLFLWTRQGLTLDPNYINTEVLDGRLRLSKSFVDIPDDVRAEAAEVPYLSEVAPGSIFVEVVEVPLPLEPFHPYNALERRKKVHLFEQVELAIGWLPEGAVDVHLDLGTDDQPLLAADHRQVRAGQELLVAELPISVPAFFGPADSA